MSGLPREHPGTGGGTETYGILLGRADDPDMAGKCQVWIPGRYGPGVQTDHLARCTIQVPPTGGDQCTTGTTPDDGSAVTILGSTGNPNGVIVSVSGSEVQGDGSGTSGNMFLLQGALGLASSFFSQDGNVQRNKPSTYKEVKEKGALIRKLVNRGLHSHNQLKSIPSHGALPSTSGIKLPQIKNIPTAKQAFTNIPTADMISNLPGTVMSLLGMLNSIKNSKSYQSRIASNVPANVFTALNSITELAQSGETNDMGGSVTNNRVNEAVFMENAVNLISKCSTLSELNYSIERMIYDTSLHGLGQEDLILNLSDYNGDYNIGENVYQYDRTANTKTLIQLGKVKSWDSTQRILYVSDYDLNNFSPSNNVTNQKAKVDYTIKSVNFLNENNCVDYVNETPFGSTTICIDVHGNTVEKKSNTVYNAQQSFTNQMSSYDSFPSIGGGNLFGGSAGTMFDMLKRLPPQVLTNAKALLENTNSKSNPQHKQEVVKTLKTDNLALAAQLLTSVSA